MKNGALLFIFALLLSAACSAQSEKEVKNVAIFVHEEVELFDFAGPGEVFEVASRYGSSIKFNVYTVAATEDQITSQTFLKIIPNYSIENCPPPDILVLPGGMTSIPLRNPKVIDWIKKVNEDTDITLSVCSGVHLLGKAGLLEGIKATSHWGAIPILRKKYPNTEVLENTKFVDNGKIITSGGVSSGIEGSLHVVSRLAGKETAEKVARYMEYNNWDNRVGLVVQENPFISLVKKQGFKKAYPKLGESKVFHGELLNLCIDYLENNKVGEALPILEYLTKEYPDSYNAWNSLAECHMKSGNKDLARKCLKKSLLLNPKNEKVKKMLASLN